MTRRGKAHAGHSLNTRYGARNDATQSNGRRKVRRVSVSGVSIVVECCGAEWTHVRDVREVSTNMCSFPLPDGDGAETNASTPARRTSSSSSRGRCS